MATLKLTELETRKLKEKGKVLIGRNDFLFLIEKNDILDMYDISLISAYEKIALFEEKEKCIVLK